MEPSTERRASGLGYRVGIGVILAGLLMLAFSSIWNFFLPLLIVEAIVFTAILGAIVLKRREAIFAVQARGVYQALALAGATIAVAALMPWVGAFSHVLRPVAVFGGAALVLGGAFLAARQLPWGWAAMSAPFLLVICVWVGAASLSLAMHSGWQDMTWDDSDSIGGSAFGIFIIILFGTFAAPIPGLLIGFLSQTNKPRVTA